MIEPIALLVVGSPQSRHVPKLDMHSLLLVETTNDMPFSPPETKYDEPFQVIGNRFYKSRLFWFSKNSSNEIIRTPSLFV